MLKRLLIAVFVLGLIMAWVGTAFSADQVERQPLSERHPAPSIKQAPNAHIGAYPWNLKPAANHKAVPTPGSVSGSELSLQPDTLSVPCPQIKDWLWSPGLYNQFPITGTDGYRLAMSFDVQLANQVTVYAAGIRIYAITGAPSLVIQVHQDAVGNPGAVVYTQTLAPGAFGVGNFLYSFTTPVVLPYAGSYWISVGTSGAVGDVINFGFHRSPTNVVTGRGRFMLGGVWYMPTAVGLTYDYDMRIASQFCQTYTSCYSYIVDPRGMYGVTMPDDGFPDASNLVGIGQRFVAAGPETLSAVKILDVDETAFGLPGQTLYGPTSTNGFKVSIWTDSSGSIDKSTGPLYSVTVPAGLANVYPYTLNNGAAAFKRDTMTALFPMKPIMLGPYHITVEPTTPNPANGTPLFRFAVDGTYGGGSVSRTSPGTDWHLVGTDPLFCSYEAGAASAYDGNFDIRPQMCKDEYYECQNQVLYDHSAMYTYYMYSGGPRTAVAQRIKGNPANRVEKLRFQVTTDLGTVGLIAHVYANSGYGPGAVIYSQTVAAPTFYPGWTEVVIPGGIHVNGDFYIGFEGIFPDVTDSLYPMSEDGAHAGAHKMKNGGMWDYRITGTPHWRSLADSIGYDDNLMAEAYFCSLPVQERICVTENDWPTYQHDNGRTGASGTAIGPDAYCKLTLNWKAYRPTARGTNFNGPIIWNNHVICAFSASTVGSYLVFNLQTGAIEYEFAAAPTAYGPGYPDDFGGNIRCTPTVATVTVGGTPKPVLFLSSGNPGGVSAYDMSAFPAVTQIWGCNANNLPDPYKGHTLAMGATRYCPFIVLNVGGSDVVYWCDDNNTVYAAYAATGLPYTPFNNGTANYTPYVLPYPTQKSGASDGISLFYGQWNAAGKGGIVAILAANGKTNWTFTSNQATVIFGGNTIEGIYGGVATDAGEVYAESRMGDATVSGAVRGVFYRVDALTGALLSAAGGDRALFSGPIIDKKRVYVPCIPAYIGGVPPSGFEFFAFDRADGTQSYANIYFVSNQPGVQATTSLGQQGWYVDGLLTCEPDSSDYVFAFDVDGYLSCIKADNGSEIFHRRVDYGPSTAQNVGGTGAIGVDAVGKSHIVFCDLTGGLYDLTMQTPRARLELLTASSAVAVPFGSPVDTVVTFPKMYTNTGCTPLVVSLTARTTSNGTTVPAPGRSVDARLDNSAMTLANQLTGENAGWEKADGRIVGFAPNAEFDPANVRTADSRDVYNHSATATPAFLNENGTYTGDVFAPANGNIITNPGDTAGISVHANGPLVNRGPNSFYCEYTVINDPDYYLNSPTRRPEVYLSLVGGCLDDSTTIKFGAAGANVRLATNTLMITNGDWSKGPSGTHGLTIDGDITISYQMFQAYGVSKHRQAFTARFWDGSSNEWIGVQADPNYCDLSCKPHIYADTMNFGSISANGIAYTPILGSVVCRSFIDSVQDFNDGGGGWDWSSATAPFNNDSTMGLAGSGRTIGVKNAPNVGDGLLLNNMTLDITTFTERNGRAVPGWKYYAFNDEDLGALDTVYGDFAHSAAWSTPSPTSAWIGTYSGWIKVPFGCGYTGMKNAAAANQKQWSYIPDWDTSWVYASKPAGAAYSSNMTGTTDQGSFFCYDEYDFPASGSHTVGTAHFAFVAQPSGTDAAVRTKIAKLADLINKWTGFGRGDVNNDGVINLADIIYLADHINYGRPGAIPFAHLGDVNASGGAPTIQDVQYLVDFYFNYGPCPKGAFVF